MKRLLLLLLVASPLARAAEDPVVAQRGKDHVTLGQARAILAGLDADNRHKLAAGPALTDFLRNVLLQRAVLAEAQAQHWDQRPEIAAMLQRARDLAVAQSFLASQATMPQDYPTDADISTAYEQNRQRFMQPRLYHLSQVVVLRGHGRHAQHFQRQTCHRRGRQHGQPQPGRFRQLRRAGTATISVPIESGTVSAPTVNPNSLTKTGAGTLTFTAANLYSGTTTVNAGRLTVDTGGRLGSGRSPSTAGARC